AVFLPASGLAGFFAAAVFAAGFLAAGFFAGFLAAGFLAAAFTATAGLRPLVLPGVAGPAAASVAISLAPPSAPALPVPGFAGRALLLSNSKLILPSGCLTRKALNLRRVREDTKPVSRSVLPSASS